MPPHAYVHQVDQPKLDMFLVAQAELAADSLVFDLAIFKLALKGPRQEERSERSVHLVVWKICWRNKLS
jgi:hypothetical protein